MAGQENEAAKLATLRPGQCTGVKDGKRCVRPAWHTGVCNMGPPLLSLDDLFGKV
jgi:hypothetical protein